MNAILITGATGEIGRSLVSYYIKMNYTVIAVARSSNKLEKLEKHYRNNSLICYAVDYQVTNSYNLLTNIFKKNVITKIVLSPPKIPVVNNCLPDYLLWEQQFKSVFIMPLEFLKFLITLFESNTRTKIVLLSGITSKQILQQYAMSSAIRAAWIAEIKVLAHALGVKNIHINALSLGGVLTESFKEKLKNQAQKEGITPDELLKQKVDNVPLKKYASMDEVIQAIDALLGPMSDHMTGNNIVLDGGYVKSFS